MENPTDQSERERIAQLAATCVCSSIRRASRLVTNYYDSFTGPVSGLRVSQLIVLVILYLAGPQTINQLADLVVLDRTTLGRNLRPLAQQGLLTMSPGSDHRTRMVTLTAEGGQVLLHVLPQWEAAQAEMVAHIGRERVPAFLAQLGDVAEHLRNL